MDVLVLIDKLDDLVHNAKKLPLTDTVRIESDEVYSILDDMRQAIPREIKQARWIVKERQDMLAEAKREAERIIQEARDKAEELASEKEVVRIAHEQEERIMAEADSEAREIRDGAEDYADEIFSSLEVSLDKFLTAVQRSREKLAQRAQAQGQEPVGVE